MHAHAVTPSTGPNAAGGLRANGITFDRFVRACVVVKSLTENFQRLDTHRQGERQFSAFGIVHPLIALATTGYVTMQYEQFLEISRFSGSKVMSTDH